MPERKSTGRHNQLTGPDRWQISYADLLTLLLGFFIVMYAVSAMESDQREDLIAQLQASFLGEDSADFMANTSSGDIPFLNTRYFEGSTLKKTDFSAERQGDWLYLQAASEALFASGSATLLPEATRQLDTLIQALPAHNGVLEVAGHTDNIPINTALFSSNWALSSARAVAIVNYLADKKGIAGDRLRAVGYGEYAPVADNATPEGRSQNRRVVIKVEASTQLPSPLTLPLNAAATGQPVADNSFTEETSRNPDATPPLESLKQNLESKGLVPQRTEDGRLLIRHDP